MIPRQIMFWVSLQGALFLAVHLQSALSLISLPVCEGGCMAQNSNGTWCFHPTFNPPTSTICQGVSDPRFLLALQAHVRGHVSIAYYQIDGTFLGGSDYVVTSSVIICSSGINGQGSLNTLCSDVSSDNDIADSGDWCMVDGGPSPVTDECYGAIDVAGSSPSTTGSNAPQGTPGISRSDQIALGVGLGVGLPTLFAGIAALIFRPYYLRKRAKQPGIQLTPWAPTV